MSLAQINPFDYFSDTNGDPLDQGYIYVGKPNQDPMVNPIAIYYDAAMTIPAPQPLRTVAGYISNPIAPQTFFTNQNYSVSVRDKNQVVLFYVANFSSIVSNTPFALQLAASNAWIAAFQAFNQAWSDNFIASNNAWSANFQATNSAWAMQFQSDLIQRYLSFNNRGNWAVGTSYAIQDLVIQGNIAYICLVAHTSVDFNADLSANKWAIYQGATKSELGSGVGSSLVGFMQASTGAVVRTTQDKDRESVSVLDFGAVSGSSNQSVIFQKAADAAKATTGKLLINGRGTATTYAFTNVDISGLDVIVEPNVSIVAYSGASGYSFVVVGTSGARVTSKTRLYNANLDGGGIMSGVFSARYADYAEAHDCSAVNIPTGVSPDGAGVTFYECIYPKVVHGFYSGGRTGALFTSCTKPIADGVVTDNQGRDGILFYTSPTGTTTTDALAINCKTTKFCINGEAGRGGVQFYGVRRAKALGCTSSDDSSQTFDDTAAIRFRDCEDFFADSYNASQCRTGVLVNNVGDYASAPHNIVVRGAIAGGNVDSTTKYGIAVAAIGVVCPVTGAKVSNVAGGTGAAGIYHAGSGDISGSLSDMPCSGVISSGTGTKIAVNCTRVGTGGTSVAAVSVSGHAVIGNCTFSDNRGTPTATLAIRVNSGGIATLGANHYGVGITDFVQADTGSTIKRGSAPIRQKFAGTPSTGGTPEAGTQAMDTNGVMYTRIISSWYTTPFYVGKNITTSRPALASGLAGALYFDTTLAGNGKPIWWTGTAWVDSTGAVV